MLISKKRYLQGFGICVILLGFLRAANPGWGINGDDGSLAADTLSQKDSVAITALSLSMLEESEGEGADEVATQSNGDTDKADKKKDAATQHGRHTSIFFSKKKHPIYSVPSYANTFPDINDVQIVAAQRYGIDPIHNSDTTLDGMGLVYVGESPYYDVARLNASEPYLVPRAAQLLHDIGRAYFDSLQVKRIPLHRFIVTSLLRTHEHVDKLRRHNGNATENSCHLYATTFDISYNRYNRVGAPDMPLPPPTRSDTLKWVLSEVLRDMREKGRCYIKYEVKQGCFHVTTK